MTTKHYLLGTAAALAIASITSLASAAASIDTVIAPRVAASDLKCTLTEPAADLAALGIDQTVLGPQLAKLPEGGLLIQPTGDIKSAQRPIFAKTMLAEGNGGAKKPNLLAPALGGTTVV